MFATGMKLRWWFGQLVADYSAGLNVAVILFYDRFVNGAELICYWIANLQLNEWYSFERAKPVQY